MSNEIIQEQSIVRKRKRNPFGKQSHTTTLLLSFFLGGFGAHRFYTGYVALGILQLLTLGGCGIWTLIDFICICFNKFKNSDGLLLREYNKTLSLTFFYVWIALYILSTISGMMSISEALSLMKGM